MFLLFNQPNASPDRYSAKLRMLNIKEEIIGQERLSYIKNILLLASQPVRLQNRALFTLFCSQCSIIQLQRGTVGTFSPSTCQQKIAATNLKPTGVPIWGTVKGETLFRWIVCKPGKHSNQWKSTVHAPLSEKGQLAYIENVLALVLD